MTEEQPEYITTTEARKLMGISGHKMAQLLREGKLAHEMDEADSRVKLIKRADVLAWIAGRKRHKKQEGRSEDGTKEATNQLRAAFAM